jgi:uncharacterized lipoprotein YbaY
MSPNIGIRIRTLPRVALAVCLWLIANTATAQSIQGTATYRERMALPPAAVFEAALEDVSRADAPAETIALTRVASPGNPPIAFTITYDPASILPDHRYVVRARILLDDKLIFTTDTATPGTWKSSGSNQIRFGPLALTRTKCPAGSLHDHIVKQWRYIRSYVMKDGHLFLSLMADGGIYEFEPQPR